MMDLLQISALLFGFLGCASTVLSLHNSYWKESSEDGSVILTSDFFENLWMACADDSTGSYSCRDFHSLLALPGYIHACRALVIAAVALGGFGLMATLVGMQCCKIGGDNHVLKGRIVGFGGVCFILQGLCMMIAVSWYAFKITQTFFDQLYEGTKYEMGQGLYIGWSSGLLALCAGSCLLCSCGCNAREERNVFYTTNAKSDLQNFRSRPNCNATVISPAVQNGSSARSHVSFSQYV